MRKVYLLGAALLMAGSTAIAQNTVSNYRFGTQGPGEDISEKLIERRVQPVTSNFQDRAITPLWSEDFNGGTGLTYGNSAWTAAGTNASYWERATSANHPFGWTTVFNGDALQWDSYNNVPTETQFSTTSVQGTVTSDNIDLSAATTSNTIITFKTEAIWCCGVDSPPFFMYVSNNGGSTWSTAIPVDMNVDRNIASYVDGDPQEHVYNITPYVDATPANNNDVQIRFEWDGTTVDQNGQYSTHYYWIIDDIAIYEAPAYDVTPTTAWVTDNVQYYEYPITNTTQNPASSPLIVQTEVRNLGTSSPTNLQLEVTVFDGATIVHGPQTGGTLTVGGTYALDDMDTITFTTGLDMNTLSAGIYDIRMVTTYTETDGQIENDTVWRSVEMTANSLSHNNAEQFAVRDYWEDGNGYKIGAFFDVNVADVVHGMDTYLDAGTTGTPSTTSSQIEFYIHEVDGGGTYTEIAGPFTFDLEGASYGAWVTWNFHESVEGYSSPVTFQPGTLYVLSFGIIGGDVVWYRNNYYDYDYSCRFYYDGDGNWYWNGNEALLRGNFDESLSIGKEYDYNFSIGQNQPNPMSDNSTIRYTLGEAANVAVTFTDAAGKVVSTMNEGNKSAGTYTINVDGNDFAEGIYFYTFTVGDKQITKRMVVTK